MQPEYTGMSPKRNSLRMHVSRYLPGSFQCNLSISPYPVLTNILKRRVVRIPVHGVRPDVVD